MSTVLLALLEILDVARRLLVATAVLALPLVLTSLVWLARTAGTRLRSGEES